MAKNIVERTSKDYGGFKDSFDQIAGILSLLAPDPNDPLEYIGASAGPYGLPVLLARKLQKAKDLIERGKASSRMGAQMGSDAEMDAGEKLINEGNALIREVMSEPGINKKQIDEFLNPPMPKSDLTTEEQLEKIKNLKEKFGPTKKNLKEGGLVKGLKASGTTMNYGDYGRSYK